MKKLSKKQKLIVFIAILLVAVILAIVITTNIMEINIANGSYNSANNNSSSGNLLPEYIKAGITLGGVTGTLEDLDTSDATATAEDIAWGKVAYARGERIVGTYSNLTLKDLEIGDYVAYSPGSETVSSYSLPTTYSGHTSDQTISRDSLNWRVLSINEDGTVDLISATPTSQDICLQGSAGYNNGVYLLNDVAASLYSNKSLGVTARSLTIEDIEAGMNESGLDYVHSYNSGYATVGDTKTYTDRYYPNLYAQENGSGIDLTTTNDPNSEVKTDGIGQSDKFYDSPTTETYSKANSSLTVTQTYYYRTMNSSYYKNSTFYNLVHPGNSYWLASRYVSTDSFYARFGLRVVNHINLSGLGLFNSYNYARSDDYRLRPVVSLKSNIRLGTGDGKTAETAYQIIQ